MWKTDKTVSHIGEGGQKGESADGPVIKTRNYSKGVHDHGKTFLMEKLECLFSDNCDKATQRQHPA